MVAELRLSDPLPELAVKCSLHQRIKPKLKIKLELFTAFHAGCNKVYVGETRRTVGERIKEHAAKIANNLSAIAEHYQNYHYIFLNVSFLNYVAKYPNSLRPGYHGNIFKNPASLFCVYCSRVSSPKYGVNRFRFCATFSPVFSQSGASLGYHVNQSKTTTVFHN